MSKQLLMSTTEVGVWLRRFRTVVMAYVGLILLVGVVYIAAKLIGAEFGALFVGVVATIAGLALAAVAWGGLWLAAVVFDQGDRLERQRERIALLESSLQMLEVELEQKTSEAPPPVAEHVPQDTPFPRIAPPEIEPPPSVAAAVPPRTAPVEQQLEAALAAGDIRSARHLWQALDGGVTPVQRVQFQDRVDELAAQVASTLRAEFVGLVREEDFHAALRKGEEIIELLPDSRMRHDFDVLRPHLEARAAEHSRANGV